MDITVSRGRSSDRAKGGAHSWPSPIVPKLPSRDNSGDDRHVAFGTESGFPKFSHVKIFRWRLCIWQSSPCLALLFQKSVSQNDLPDLDSLVQIKNRDTNRVRTVVGSLADVLLVWRVDRDTNNSLLSKFKCAETQAKLRAPRSCVWA